MFKVMSRYLLLIAAIGFVAFFYTGLGVALTLVGV